MFRTSLLSLTVFAVACGRPELAEQNRAASTPAAVTGVTGVTGVAGAATLGITSATIIPPHHEVTLSGVAIGSTVHVRAGIVTWSFYEQGHADILVTDNTQTLIIPLNHAIAASRVVLLAYADLNGDSFCSDNEVLGIDAQSKQLVPQPSTLSTSHSSCAWFPHQTFDTLSHPLDETRVLSREQIVEAHPVAHATLSGIAQGTSVTLVAGLYGCGFWEMGRITATQGAPGSSITIPLSDTPYVAPAVFGFIDANHDGLCTSGEILEADEVTGMLSVPASPSANAEFECSFFNPAEGQ